MWGSRKLFHRTRTKCIDFLANTGGFADGLLLSGQRMKGLLTNREEGLNGPGILEWYFRW